ncbi:MAG: hypothetical protein FJ278_03085, partial [Planctomycetes bacterium]|nr:hypothetical protein [Planctomycetota bacterium]
MTPRQRVLLALCIAAAMAACGCKGTGGMSRPPSPKEGSSPVLVMRLYDVRDLLDASEGEKESLTDRARGLVELIVNMIAPEGWGLAFVAGANPDTSRGALSVVSGQTTGACIGEGRIAYRAGALVGVQTPEI